MAPEQTGNIVGANGKSASEADMKFMANFVDCMIGKPNVDWDRLAKAMNLKDAKCTKERWRQIQKKLGWDTRNNDAAGGNKSPSPHSNAATPTPRKRKSVAADSPATPSKVAKRGAAKGKAVETAIAVDSGDEPMPDSPSVTKTPGKGKGKARAKPKPKAVVVEEDEDEDEASSAGDGFSAGFGGSKVKNEPVDDDLKADEEFLKAENAGEIV